MPDCRGIFFDDAQFRKHVVMAEHGYGCGEYKYFKPPNLISSPL